MVVLYRRHRKDCPYTSRSERRCRCPIYAEGRVGDERIRESLNLRSWEAATLKVRNWEAAGTLKAKTSPTIQETIEAISAELVTRNLAESTRKKYRVLLSQLTEFADKNGYTELCDLTPEAIGKFRHTWRDGAISSSKKLERLRSFFGYAIDMGFTSENPAKKLKPPKVDDVPTLPFEADEVQRILLHANGKWHALTQTLLYSGLRIGDAMKLTPTDFEGNSLFIKMQKSRKPVRIPVPQTLLDELKTLPLSGGYYFWNRAGDSKLATATGNARRAFRKLCKAAGVKNGHPHRLRDTFAVRLLSEGVSIEFVSKLLGHSSIRITEKHYAPWVQSLQTKLEQEVMKTWEKPKLTRVK